MMGGYKEVAEEAITALEDLSILFGAIVAKGYRANRELTMVTNILLAKPSELRRKYDMADAIDSVERGR